MDTPPAPRRDLSAFWVVLAIVVLWLAYLQWFGPRARTDRATGRPADYAWALERLDGTPVDLGAYRGKALFLNVWATWCPPCVGEMPSIVALAGRPGLEGVEFVCVSVDDDLEPVRRFARERGMEPRLTVLRAVGNPPPAFETTGIPATFLVGPDGVIVRSEVGGLDWDDPEVVRTLAGLADPAKVGADR